MEYIQTTTTPRQRHSDDSGFPFTIAASRSTQQIQLENNKLSFWVRESRLIIAAGISVLAMSSAVSIILVMGGCEVNGACFSVISAIVGGWLSLLMRNGKGKV
jgi:hypothetical protein